MDTIGLFLFCTFPAFFSAYILIDSVKYYIENKCLYVFPFLSSIIGFLYTGLFLYMWVYKPDFTYYYDHKSDKLWNKMLDNYCKKIKIIDHKIYMNGKFLEKIPPYRNEDCKAWDYPYGIDVNNANDLAKLEKD